MYKHRRYIVGILITLILAMTLTPMASAAESIQFTDVPDNAPYADMAIYMKDQHWINGIGNNRLAPNASCTAKDLCTILGRALYGVNNQAEIINIGIQNDWFQSANMLNTPLTRESMYEILFKATDQPYYLYTTASGTPATNSAKILRMCNPDATSTETVSRAEIIMAIYKTIVQNITLETSSFIQNTNISLATGYDEELITETLLQALQLPDELWETFADYNGAIVIGSEFISMYEQQHNMQVSGLYDSGTCEIHLRDIPALIHEMGHFVYYTWNLDEIAPAIYQNEKNIAVQLIRAYAGTNPSEMFAEFFKTYMLNDENTRLNLQTNMPGTYDLLCMAKENGWYT